MKNHFYSSAAVSLLAATLMASCVRDPVWDAAPQNVEVQRLTDRAALIDGTANRVLLLGVAKDLTLIPTSLPIGHGLAASATTPDGSELLVLSRGDVPRRHAPNDQKPRLILISSGDDPKITETYPLSDPLSGLAVDPLGRFAIVYPAAADTSFVENPNELSVVDVTAPVSGSNPTPITLRSFGGRPQSFFFTPSLDIASQSRRLLCVLTDRDLGIIDLSVPGKGDITVPLSSTGTAPEPAQIAVTNGIDGVDDARLAVRLAQSSSVVLIDLPPIPANESASSAHDFRPTPNIVFAGGTPSDIAFVNTDGGLRLAALVPASAALALIDPLTGISSNVAVGGVFEHMSLVTDVVGPAGGGSDVALLWSTSSPHVAFVALGSTVGKPYKSVESLSLDAPISAVLDVPSPNQRLKILVGQNNTTFYVLDLVARTASPLFAENGDGGATNLSLSPDGRGAWVFAAQQSDLAWLDLTSLHPKNLTLASSVIGALDIAKKGGGRALVALRDAPDIDVTVIDGDDPSIDTSIDYPSVLLGALP